MSDKHGVEIDYCPKCRGIWLDRGELEKIIEREASMGVQNHRNDYRHDDDDDHYKHHNDHSNPNYKHRKGGFMANLFDF
jgi:Zn-finger nucleic acid-binding protein